MSLRCFWGGGLLHFPPAQKNQYWEAARKTFHRSITAQPGAPISLLLRPLGTGLARLALPTWGGRHSPLAAGKSAIKGKTWITSLLVWAISNLRAPDLWLGSCADSHTHTHTQRQSGRGHAQKRQFMMIKSFVMHSGEWIMCFLCVCVLLLMYVLTLESRKHSQPLWHPCTVFTWNDSVVAFPLTHAHTHTWMHLKKLTPTYHSRKMVREDANVKNVHRQCCPRWFRGSESHNYKRAVIKLWANDEPSALPAFTLKYLLHTFKVSERSSVQDSGGSIGKNIHNYVALQSACRGRQGRVRRGVFAWLQSRCRSILHTGALRSPCVKWILDKNILQACSELDRSDRWSAPLIPCPTRSLAIAEEEDWSCTICPYRTWSSSSSIVTAYNGIK